MVVRSKILFYAEILKTPSQVVALRSKCGYSATKCDTSAAITQKTLRCQFGHSYYQKNVRNN